MSGVPDISGIVTAFLDGGMIVVPAFDFDDWNWSARIDQFSI